MTISNSLLNKCISTMKRTVDELAAAMEAKPERPAPEDEDEPRPIRRNPFPQGSQEWFRALKDYPAPVDPGIDQNDVRRRLEGRKVRLPKSPEEALGILSWRPWW